MYPRDLPLGRLLVAEHLVTPADVAEALVEAQENSKRLGEVLVAWELMSLAAYVLVTFEHERSEVRRAGWVYLIATHIGTAFLIAMFLTTNRNVLMLSAVVSTSS